MGPAPPRRQALARGPDDLVDPRLADQQAAAANGGATGANGVQWILVSQFRSGGCYKGKRQSFPEQVPPELAHLVTAHEWMHRVYPEVSLSPPHSLSLSLSLEAPHF